MDTTYFFIVYFDVTDSNSDSLIKFRTNLMINLLYSSGYYASLLVIVCQSQHCVRFTTSCLTIAQNCSIVALNHWLHNTSGRQIINIILGGVMHNMRKLKLPTVKLVVHETLVFFVNMNVKVLSIKSKLDIHLHL